MNTATFDTLGVTRRLRDTGFEPAQAGALVETLCNAQGRLVSREHLDARLELLENRLEARMAILENRLDARMDALANSTKAEIAHFETKFSGQVHQLEAKVEGKFNLLYWMIGSLMLGMLGVLVKAFFPV